ncbi:MAG: methyltransferase domain-containing protein [Acidobacteria bacterium]|jgi:ubiquinone/menaquinone biosynthesis C-methylase UbiE/uncharacterized protein YbaR (Trm112 family)|nr:methyltransferase domain-containing protein [Acidobacteriota bacterium]
MDEWLKNNLVCPRDKGKLQISENKLTCSENHIYPVVDGIPIMLLEEVEHIHNYITETLKDVAKLQTSENSENKSFNFENKENEVDPFVQSEIPLTCGNLYIPLLHNLSRYPLPELRLPQSAAGERFLDVGCNWGRWTIVAAQKGYQPVGIDPSLNAVLAARRISRQLSVSTTFVVGDARYLPFAENCFDVGFCYSVLQHFSKENARISMEEMARTVKKGGKILIQMPNKYGIRSFYQNYRRGFTEGEGFEIRYWSPAELMDYFKKKFGKTKMTVDCYFGLGIQKNDVDLLPPHYKMVVHSSEFLRQISRKLPFITKVADSVYLESVNQKQS